MNNRQRTPKPDNTAATVGCLFVILWAAFWVTVIIVAVHFVAKLW